MLGAYSHLTNKHTGWNKRGYINSKKFPPCSSDKLKKVQGGGTKRQKSISKAVRLLDS